jgi:predicted small lipoprotein YifL
MRRLILPIALAVTTATLAGCGQKGPLVLPPATAGATAKPQATTPTSGTTSVAPPPASTSSQPFNSVLHQ